MRSMSTTVRLTGAYTGTITENAGTTSSAIGYGETFNGSTGNYNLTMSPVVTGPPNFRYLWTVSGWFYLNSTAGGGVCLSGNANGTWHHDQTAIYFGDGSTGTGAGAHPTVGTYEGFSTTSATVTPNAWHHVAWQYSGTGSGTTAGTQNIYLDGAAQTLTTATAEESTASYAGNFFVGVATSNRTTQPFFNGSLDEFRVDSAYRDAGWINCAMKLRCPRQWGQCSVAAARLASVPGFPSSLPRRIIRLTSRYSV